ncbi:hypothetical protein [Streptomyces sviceus]|uniref:hypothetical protein n=1 Tax=Streptomyces sviceus TaxID=285530 RepID=UPI0036EBFC01
MTPAKERTWPIWRGFGKVTHLTGDSNSKQLKTVTVYLRSMNGDQLLGAAGKTPAANARKSVEVSGIKAGKITDAEEYAGLVRESVTYDAASEATETINDPRLKRTATQHKPYAETRPTTSAPPPPHTRTRTNITSGITPRDCVRTVATTYGDYGMAATVEDRWDDAVFPRGL